TEDAQGVWDFAAGSMRSYLIFKEKVAQFNADTEIQQLVADLNARGGASPKPFSMDYMKMLKSATFDLPAIRQQGYAYERLDQLTMELLLGVR
ncbi:MAG TPA: hypothetical protein VIJ16_09465, partial [Gemmatimonadaceae bacterium]